MCISAVAGKINGMRNNTEKKHCRSQWTENRKCAFIFKQPKNARLKPMYVCVRYMFHFVVAGVALAVDYRSIRVEIVLV